MDQTMKPVDHDQKTLLLTGASRGIGAERVGTLASSYNTHKLGSL